MEIMVIVAIITMIKMNDEANNAHSTYCTVDYDDPAMTTFVKP